jgi:hypothetical protein
MQVEPGSLVSIERSSMKVLMLLIDGIRRVTGENGKQ